MKCIGCEKKKKNPMHRYFLLENGKSKCLVPNCTTNLAGKNTTNLGTHLTKIHGKSAEGIEYCRLLALYEKDKTENKKRKVVTAKTPKSKQLRLDEV